MDTFSCLTGSLAPIGETPGPPFRVFLSSGAEALSSLFHFSLSVGVPRSDVETRVGGGEIEAVERALLGQQVEFRVGESGLTRYGIVAAVHDEGADTVEGAPYVRVRIEIVPRVWLLKHRRNSRIFQGKYVHEIVSQVLTEAGVAHRWNLQGTYPKRIYCTQYDETDLDFVSRLLAEEGILYFFEHEGEFAGGAAAKVEPPEESMWNTVAGVMESIGKGVTKAGELFENDTIKMVGAGTNLAADWTKTRPKDEEADDPIVLGAGTAGPAGAGDVLAFIDQATAYPEGSHRAEEDRILTLTFRAPSELGTSPHEIVELAPTQRVRTDRVEMRDYDFRRPMLVLQANAATAGQATAVPLEVYNHHGQYEKPEITAQLAQVELEQHRADVLRCAGQGTCPRLLPGHQFAIENVAATGLPHERYSVVSVRHESKDRGLAGTGIGGEMDALVRGVARAIAAAKRGADMAEPEIRRALQQAVGSSPGDREYWSWFECVPAGTAHRPPRPSRAPRHVTEVAVVVGPPGKDIHTDRYGRIKIQFNWDRHGEWKETSSCWVRVVQPWAGTGFGFQFIPRVGMEVLVTFLAGDPDRPVVLGSLYNATHATPEPLPQRSTRSGIRSQTTPNGGGFNEFSFEDQAGVERVHLHAQKDLHEIVRDTHRSEVKNKVTTVSQRLEIGVGGDQRWGVGGDRSDMVGKNAFERVGGNLTSDVYANRTDRVHGNALSQVSGMAFRSVATDEAQVVQGNLNLSVNGDMITQIGGRTSGENSHAVTFVQGTSVLTATERILVKAEKADGTGAQGAVRLECGDSYIEIAADRITLRSKQIDLLSSETTNLKGSSSTLALSGEGAKVSADPIELTTPDGSQLSLNAANATVTGPSGAVVQGSSVALKSGQAQGETADESKQSEEPRKNLKLVFSHLRGTDSHHAIGGTRYRIVADDVVHEDKTSPEGKVEVAIPKTTRVVYVVLWANETHDDVYPREDGPLHWLLRIRPKLAETVDLPGARVRLRNLGYEPGTDLEEERVDAPTRAALLEFQVDQDLPRSGELDDATKKRLDSVYAGKKDPEKNET